MGGHLLRFQIDSSNISERLSMLSKLILTLYLYLQNIKSHSLNNYPMKHFSKIELNAIFLLIIIFSFCIKFSSAQPVLNYGIYPLIGESYNVKSFNASSFDPGISGENVTWDFSGIDLPDDAYDGDGLIANAVGLDDVICDISEIPTGNLAYAYESAEGWADFIKTYDFSKISEEGLAYCGGEYSGLTIYTDPKDFLYFPIEYGDSYSDLFSTTDENYSPFDTSIGYSNGEIQVVADGYGTLILPFITITNVLRVKTHEVIDYMPSGSTTTIDTWYWYNANTKGEIFSYEEHNDSDGPDYETFSLNQNIILSTAISSESTSQILALYPNPTNGVFNIAFCNPIIEPTHIKIFSVTGELVYYTIINSGTNELRIELPETFSGLAIVMLNNGYSIESKEIIINN